MTASEPTLREVAEHAVPVAKLDQLIRLPSHRAVVRQLLAGKNNRQIADALRLREASVKIYMSRIFQRLDVESRLQLVIKLHREGIWE